MERLSGLDSAFFALETPHSTGHVGGLTILAPSAATRALDLARLTALYAERLPLVPVMRKRLVGLPLGIDRPYWVDDPDFDLSYHLREDGLPHPGDDTQLGELVARLHARPLDRTRPLWEATLITGLARGRVAVYLKVHHAAIDGVSGADLLAVLTDTDPGGRTLPDPEPWNPPPLPSLARLGWWTARDVAVWPVSAAKVAVDSVRSLPRLLPAVSRQRDPGQVTSALDGHPIDTTAGLAPPTPLNRTITPHRRFAFTTLSLDQVKEVKNAFGVSVNDVVMAVSAGVLRTWLLQRDALPEHPLAAMVPVSIRDESGHGLMGNRVSAMLAQVPTHVADPVARLEAAHEATRHAKAQQGLIPQGLFDEATDLTPPVLTNAAFRLVFDTHLRNRLPVFNVVISNIPGPPVPMYLAGARVEAHFPVSVVTDGLALNITVMSYCGRMQFGLVADRSAVPDVDTIAANLHVELAALRRAARRATRAQTIAESRPSQ
ncbi:MAG TPA: wax ester/triacylglycerol synthase family O-acyltransferase [Nocardioides sp.]|uniref:WS/DGAT/MGAT family O-acyltransferase n=1 Tax=Nocardioides sp. TaxID=35761 RepID=UPI002C6C195C|nr:wax ester/triacylglycerol synthase family O-acyltransferase [Nocardioides sp.]HQR26459.1 wax ester/triacylglycerol synthase family O-acyltransferase [Nocardioides sp.]